MIVVPFFNTYKCKHAVVIWQLKLNLGSGGTAGTGNGIQKMV